MRTLTMARILLSMGWVASGILVATLGVRYTLAPSGRGSVAHLVAAFAALLLAVLAHSWMAVFLLGSGWAVRRTVRDHALDPLLVESGRELRAWTIMCALAASVLAAVLFFLRSGLAPWPMGPAWHWFVAGLAVGLQLAALLLEARAVRRNEGVLDDVAARLRGRSG